MGRGIIIDDKHTYDDWDLVLRSQDIGIPEVKTIYVDIPAGNGSIDLTEALTGEAAFEDRSGKFIFDVLCQPNERPALIAEIGAYVHGKRRKIVLPDDPNNYYLGRLEIDGFDLAGMVAALSIKTKCDPYKYKNNKTTVSGTITTGGTMNLTCNNSRKKVFPTITVSAAVQVVFGTDTFSLGAGAHTVTGIILEEGANLLTINGANGTTVSIEYQEGAI